MQEKFERHEREQQQQTNKSRREELQLSEETNFYTEADFRTFLTLDDYTQQIKKLRVTRGEEYAKSSVRKTQAGFINQLIELWELTTPSESIEKFVDRRLKEQSTSQYVQDNETGQIMRMLPQDEWETVFTSRLNFLSTEEEKKSMKNGRLLSVGASTASSVIATLAQGGLGEAIIIDPDVISTSNTTRMHGVTQLDVGTNKATYICRYLSRLNPYMKVTAIPEALSKADMTNVMNTSSVILEMVDHPPTKQLVREVAKQSGKFVVMGTGVGNNPLITVEHPHQETLPPHIQSVPTEVQDYLRTLPKDVQKGIEKTRWLISFIGRENIPLNHMANFILYGLHEVKFWAQDAPTTQATGTATAVIIKDILCEREVLPKGSIDLNSLRNEQSVQQSESQLLQQLKRNWPQIFLEGDETLRDAIDRLCNLYAL